MTYFKISSVFFPLDKFTGAAGWCDRGLKIFTSRPSFKASTQRNCDVGAGASDITESKDTLPYLCLVLELCRT